VDSKFIDLAKQELVQIEERLRKIHEEEETVRAQTTKRLKVLDEESKHLEAQMRHLKALVSPEEHCVSDDNSQEVSELIDGRGGIQSVVRRNSGLADQVYKLLYETGHEYHYKELVHALQNGGIEVPGKDPGLNLIAHIHNDNRFVRPKRGIYGLKEWYPKNLRSVGARRRKRSKDAKSTRRTQLRGVKP
jgi:hypothetical protein